MFDQKMLDIGYSQSTIRDLYTYGLERKKVIGEDNVFDFSIGNPSIPAPKIVNDTLVKLLTEEDSAKIHGYTVSPGNLEVRDAIAEYLNKTYKASTQGRYIFLTCGAAASLAIVTKAFVKPNEEVITFAPHFPEYRTYTEAVGGVLINVNPDKDFFPDFEDLEKKITSRTRLVIYDSPNNPTGAFYTEEVIKKMASVLSKKEKEYGHPIYLVSDEPYRELLYKNEEYPFVTNYYNNSIVCYSFSKSLSLPGERIGYVLVNPKCEQVDDVYAVICGAASMLGYICAPALFQHMVPYVLGHTSNLDEYKKNKEALYNSLKEIGFEVIYPTGAFYLFMKALEPDAEKFSEVAKKFELLLVPSDPFDYKGYVRIAYCVSYKQIVNSIPAFKKLYNYYKNR